MNLTRDISPNQWALLMENAADGDVCLIFLDQHGAAICVQHPDMDSDPVLDADRIGWDLVKTLVDTLIDRGYLIGGPKGLPYLVDLG